MPELPVRVDDLRCAGVVDVLEEAPPQHLRNLVLGRRIEERRLARRDGPGLVHLRGEPGSRRSTRSVAFPVAFPIASVNTTAAPGDDSTALKSGVRKGVSCFGRVLPHLAAVDRTARRAGSASAAPRTARARCRLPARRGRRRSRDLLVALGPGEREGQLAPRRERAQLAL